MKTLTTGYVELDRLTGGLTAGEIFLLSGATGAGKTSLALNIVRHIARQEKAVLYFSLKEIGVLIAQRVLSLESGVPLDAMRNHSISGTEARELTRAAMENKKWDLLVDETVGIGFFELSKKARHIQELGKEDPDEFPTLDLIVVDHLQLMKAGEDGFPGVIRDLKGLAEELEIPVLLLAIEGKTAPEREAAADTYVYLCRDGEWAWLTVFKSRSGEEGVLDLHFDLKTLDFTPRVSAGKQ
ncbi:MAG: DnaB-like helicase C-terminal domain-containing protein [Lentisphaeria bacterium]|nr:DnaB-like helicase C-terminal domain-containing protein [Lentisphaeria bacterium]